LSEDLDFSISTGREATKKTRSQSVALIKAAIERLTDRLAELRVEIPLTGSNGSTQYNAEVSYPSSLADQRETIRIEIGLREPTMIETHTPEGSDPPPEPGARSTAHSRVSNCQSVL
jgi:Nucleotidyl transferase AbiEii toxin, Type IV TA system